MRFCDARVDQGDAGRPPDYVAEIAASKTERRVDGFSDETMRAPVTYSWPGTEQELEHVVERTLAAMRSGAPITPSDLPPVLRPGP